jgi:uncharacterized protein
MQTLLNDINELLVNPQRLEKMIGSAGAQWIIIDEIQRIPDLLHEVHRLIEAKKHRFILTGSSARKLRAKGVNLLAGRALNLTMPPLTARKLTLFCMENAGLKPSRSNEPRKSV